MTAAKRKPIMATAGMVTAATTAVADVIASELRKLRHRLDKLDGGGPGVVRHLDVPTRVCKFASAGTRTFSGVATTTEVDRVGDIVAATGAVYKLPIPLLLHHDHQRPVGWVRTARVTSTGIDVSCEIAEGTADADLAWQLVQSGLAGGLSIGFRALESEPIPTGRRFTRWDWLELSVVTVPANAGARIAGKAAKPGQTTERGTVRLITASAPVRLLSAKE